MGCAWLDDQSGLHTGLQFLEAGTSVHVGLFYMVWDSCTWLGWWQSHIPPGNWLCTGSCTINCYRAYQVKEKENRPHFLMAEWQAWQRDRGNGRECPATFGNYSLLQSPTYSKFWEGRKCLMGKALWETPTGFRNLHRALRSSSYSKRKVDQEKPGPHASVLKETPL